MDFESLRIGTAKLVVSLAAALNTFSPITAPQEINAPVVLSSKNLPAPIIDSKQSPEVLQGLTLEDEEKDIKLEMVTKEPEVPISQDVMLYTVIMPSPKPTPEPKENEEEDAIIKTAQAEEKKEEKQASASPLSSPSASPSPTPTAILSGSNADKMFQMANDHRAKLGKANFEKDERLCKIAEQRAPQINGEVASGALHAGFKALNLPYWATENIAAYQTIEENFKFWIADYIHRIAVEGDAKYSCVACSGASCSQIFSSFVPK